MLVFIAQNIWVLFYSNPPGRQQAGNFSWKFLSSSFRMTFQIRYFQFGAFIYVAFLRFKYGGFSRPLLRLFRLFSDIKRFNISFKISFKRNTVVSSHPHILFSKLYPENQWAPPPRRKTFAPSLSQPLWSRPRITQRVLSCYPSTVYSLSNSPYFIVTPPFKLWRQYYGWMVAERCRGKLKNACGQPNTKNRFYV